VLIVGNRVRSLLVGVEVMRGVVVRQEELLEVKSGEEPAVLNLDIDVAGASSPEGLFDAISGAMDFPEYFGRNWDALNECFSDYFIVEDGGLGSEFGGREGVHAQAVRLRFLHSTGLLRHGDGLLRSLMRVLRYTVKATSGRRAADLHVVFQLDPTDSAESATLLNEVVNTEWAKVKLQ